MASQKYAGIGTCGGDVVIYFEIETVGAKRFASVRVDPDEFRHEEVMYEIQRAAVQRLRRHWEASYSSEALPGID